MVVLLAAGCNSPASKNHYILAERLFSDHKYAAAVDEFKKLVDSDPRSSLAHKALFRIGTLQYLYLDSYQDSIKSFRQFIALSQDQDLVFQAEKSIGEIYFSKLEDYKLAVEQYKRLLDKYPTSPEKDFFLLRMAKSYYGSLDFGKAITTYKEIVKKHPKSMFVPEAMYQIGNTYYTKGDVDDAIEAFHDVVLSYPASQQAVFAQFGIGNCYEEKDKFDEALEIYSKILDKHPARTVVEAKIRRLKERKNRSR
ncbi:MAG: tetratricopeptide repeat protein [Deltaproteobacteria bacterium]|nr:tetratricopeptide repeat protein [Deltaproteobacteria bacterium]